MLMMLFVLLLIPAIAICLAITPWLMRKDECFAVTIPETKQADPRLQRFKRRYARIVLIVAGLATALLAFLAFTLDIFDPSAASNAASTASSESAFAFMLAYVAATLALVLVSFIALLYFRQQVNAIKRQEGWVAESTRAVALTPDTDIPGPLSLAWNLLYLPALALLVALHATGRPFMDAQIPIHWDITGAPNAFASPDQGLAFIIIFTLLLGGTMTFCHAMVLHSKKPLDANKPTASALAYGMFARAQTALLVFLGLFLTLSIGLVLELSFMGLIDFELQAILIVAIVVITLIAVFFVTLKYGQNGSRALRFIPESDTMRQDEDAHWKCGIFYVNASDASLIVPKRFGVGWTMNLGRAGSWLIILGMLAFLALASAALLLILG